jgi:peptide/nickel transport system substrate-binding protein
VRFGLKRRGFFAAASLPVLTRAARAGTVKQIVFVPRAMPASLDPIATPSFATRTVSMAIFETLYGTDALLNPMPQMAREHRAEDGGKKWTLQLRPNLVFHDGTKVTARDCVASLQRWMKRDRIGRSLAERMEGIEATADDTITLHLKKPVLLPLMLTKGDMSPPVIMPAHLASTDPSTPVDPVIGSGPFRLAGGTWKPGDALSLTRFELYEPRVEGSSFTGGRRVALVDRVIFQTPDDPIQALRDGTADWVEWLPPDVTSDTLADPNVTVESLDRIGNYAMLRFNALHGVTANQRIRQAILAGIDQTAVMEAVFGEDSGKFMSPVGLFLSGSDFVSDAGMDRTGARRSRRVIRAMLKDAGYNGEALVMLDPVDDFINTKITATVIDELKQIGLLVETRRLTRPEFAAWRLHASQTPVGDDWSMFCESLPGADHNDPLGVPAGRGLAENGWPGWPDDARAARLRDTWIDTVELGPKRTFAAQLQDQMFTTAAFVPLGQWFSTTAWRTSLAGQQKGSFPVFWDVARP